MFCVNRLGDLYYIDSCRQTCSIRRVCPRTLTDMSYLKVLIKKEYTLWNFDVCDILPFVHRYKPPISSTAATKKKVDLHLHKEDSKMRIYLMSTTSFSLPIAKDIAFNLCRENFLSGKRYEVTITYPHGRVNEVKWIQSQKFHSTLLAPESIQNFALVSFIPPPIWRLSEVVVSIQALGGNKRGNVVKPGHEVNASKAASSFPGPSFITWPPSRPCCLYKRANTPALCLCPM